MEVKYNEQIVLVDHIPNDAADVETFAMPQNTITPLDKPRSRRFNGFSVLHGDVNISREVKLYREVAFARASSDVGKVKTTFTPAIEYATTACWLEFAPDVLIAKASLKTKSFTPEDVVTAIHGLEHVLHSVAPHVAGCDRHDISSSLVFGNMDKGEAHRLYLLDTFAGGVGFAEFCYDHVQKMLEWVRRSLTHCKCKDGCPQCLIVPWCPFKDQAVSKSHALALAQHMLEQVR